MCRCIDTDETTQLVMVTVLDALCLYIANDQSKSMLDDYGQKWKHTPEEFEINRKFAHVHNPTDESMTEGPVLFDN